MIFDKKQKFSIRKYSVGVASVMIGATLLGAPVVHADETEQPTETVSRESLGEGYDIPRESIGEEAPRESIGEEVPRESIGEEAPRESIGEEVPRESVGETPRESVGEDVPRESIGDTPRESVEPRETVPTSNTPADTSDYDEGKVKQVTDNRQPVERNEYTSPYASEPQKVTVDGPTKQTSLLNTRDLYDEYKPTLERAKQLGFNIKTTDKIVSTSDAYRESRNEYYTISAAISNRSRELEDFKSNRIEKRLSYTDIARQHQNLKEDVANADFTELTNAVKNSTVEVGYETTKAVVTADEYNKLEDSSWMPLSMLAKRETTHEQPAEHWSGATAVLKRGYDVTVGTNYTTMYMTINGERKQVARIEQTYTLISAPNEKVFLQVTQGGSVTAGVEKKTNDPLSIQVTIRYYGDDGQEIFSPNVYSVNDLTHSTARYNYSTNYTAKGVVAKIEANGETKLQRLSNTYFAEKSDVEQVAKGQKVTFYTLASMVGDEPTLGDEITTDSYDEVDEHGQVKGTYYFNREAGYEHVYYKPVAEVDHVDEKRSITISDSDSLIQTPMSSLSRQGREIASVNDNVNLENGARYHYKGDSTDQYAWNNGGWYGKAFINSQSNIITFNSTDGKIGEFVEMSLNYGLVDTRTHINKPYVYNNDHEELITGPTINTTNWISSIQLSSLDKSEVVHQISYTDEDGNKIADDNIQSFTRLKVRDHGTYAETKYYIKGLLTKEEQTELYKNFHETGELFFERNGQRIEAQRENMPYQVQPERYDYDTNTFVPDGEPFTDYGLVTDEVSHPKVRSFKPDRYKRILNPERYSGITWSPVQKVKGEYETKTPATWLGDSHINNYESIHDGSGNQNYIVQVIYKQSDTVEQETTRFVTVQNNVETEIAETLEGVHEAPAFIQGEKYHYNGTTTKLGSVTTHYYDLVTGDKPTDAPSHGEVKSLTRYVTLVDNAEVEIAPMLEGVNPAPTLIEYASMEYQYTGQTKLEDGITTHYYTMVVSELPTDAPSHGEEQPATRFVTVQDEHEVDVADAVEGTVPAPTFVQGEKYFYNKTTTVADGVTTHYYDLVIGEKPTEVANTGIDRVVTRFVTLQDGNEVDVAEAVEGTVPAPKFLQNEKYVYDTTNSENSIITHYYVLVQHEVPNEAPTNELLFTPMTFWRAYETDPEKLKQHIYTYDVIPPEAGVHEAEPFLLNGKYRYTGESHWDGGTMDEEYAHYYELVITEKPGDAPVEPELPEFHQEIPGDAPVEPELPEFHQEVPGDAPVEPELPEYHEDVPGDAPVEPELPEFHQEIPGDAPVEPELPEFHQEIPGDAPVEPELPEYHEEVPGDAPVEPELPEYHEEVPGDAPVEPELPEYHEEVPNEAPINEVDEFHQAVPEDAPIVPELPEYNFEVPNDAPVNEVDEFHQAIPDTAPVHEIGEFHQAIPDDAPINDVEEFHFEVPKDAPVNEVPELIVKVPSEEPVETPEVPVTENIVPVLPQTGENDSQWVSALGLVLLGMVGIQLKQKKKRG